MSPRSLAKATGATTYEGAPCPKGHGTLRSTRNCQCVQCERDSARVFMRARRAADPVRVRRQEIAAKLRKHFGLTEAQYAEMFSAQNGRCAVCTGKLISRLDDSRPFDKGTGRVPNAVGRVDHDHATGKIRGLLCSNCNQGLGKFRDNPTILLKAVGYLRASATPQAQSSGPRESLSEIEPGNRDLESSVRRGSRQDELSPFID